MHELREQEGVGYIQHDKNGVLTVIYHQGLQSDSSELKKIPRRFRVISGGAIKELAM